MRAVDQEARLEIAGLKEHIATLQDEMHQRFNVLDAKVDDIGAKVDAILDWIGRQ